MDKNESKNESKNEKQRNVRMKNKKYQAKKFKKRKNVNQKGTTSIKAYICSKMEYIFRRGRTICAVNAVG